MSNNPEIVNDKEKSLFSMLLLDIDELMNQFDFSSPAKANFKKALIHMISDHQNSKSFDVRLKNLMDVVHKSFKSVEKLEDKIQAKDCEIDPNKVLRYFDVNEVVGLLDMFGDLGIDHPDEFNQKILIDGSVVNRIAEEFQVDIKVAESSLRKSLWKLMVFSRGQNGTASKKLYENNIRYVGGDVISTYSESLKDIVKVDNNRFLEELSKIRNKEIDEVDGWINRKVMDSKYGPVKPYIFQPHDGYKYKKIMSFNSDGNSEVRDNMLSEHEVSAT